MEKVKNEREGGKKKNNSEKLQEAVRRGEIIRGFWTGWVFNSLVAGWTSIPRGCVRWCCPFLRLRRRLPHLQVPPQRHETIGQDRRLVLVHFSFLFFLFFFFFFITLRRYTTQNLYALFPIEDQDKSTGTNATYKKKVGSKTI